MLLFQSRTGITNSGTPGRPGAKWKRNLANPGSELPAQTPVPTHRYKPREVRRQGYPRESRNPSRRVVVKLGSWSACADGAPRDVGRHLHFRASTAVRSLPGRAVTALEWPTVEPTARDHVVARPAEIAQDKPPESRRHRVRKGVVVERLNGCQWRRKPVLFG